LKIISFTILEIGQIGAWHKSSVVVMKTSDPVWNHDFPEITIQEDKTGSTKPFLASVWLYNAISKTEAKPIGFFEVDLVEDLEMRCQGDKRKFWFPLNTGGKLYICFTALRDFVFPTMGFANVDGSKSTAHLPYRSRCLIQVTVYQCINLTVFKKLQCCIDVSHGTMDPTTKRLRWNPIMRTRVQEGTISPYWMETCKLEILSKEDVFKFCLHYVTGENKTFYNDKQELEICTLKVPELAKLSTAEESRRWISFPVTGALGGGALGLGFMALSNMAALSKLDEEPKSSPQRDTSSKSALPKSNSKPGLLKPNKSSSSLPNTQPQQAPPERIIFSERPITGRSAEERCRSASIVAREGRQRGAPAAVFKATHTTTAEERYRSTSRLPAYEPKPKEPVVPQQMSEAEMLSYSSPKNAVLDRAFTAHRHVARPSAGKRPQGGFLADRNGKTFYATKPTGEVGGGSVTPPITEPQPDIQPLEVSADDTVSFEGENRSPEKPGYTYWEDWDDQHPDIPWDKDDDDRIELESAVRLGLGGWDECEMDDRDDYIDFTVEYKD